MYEGIGYDEFVLNMNEIAASHDTTLDYITDPSLKDAVLGITEVDYNMYVVYSYQKSLTYWLR